MEPHQLDLSPPKYWQEFQVLCHALWELEWKCPTIQQNGRTGQTQRGVDIYGIPEGMVRYWGIQCKVKSIDAAKAPELTEAEVADEIEQAKQFEPPLQRLVVATTAPADVKISSYIRQVSEQHRKVGLFEVDVLAWPEIQSRLSKHEKLLERFYPGMSTAWKKVGEDLSEAREQVELAVAKIDHQQDSIGSLHELVAGKMQTLESVPQQLAQVVEAVTALQKAQSLGVAAQANNTFDAVGLGTYFDRQIDGFRDLIINGRSKTALELLERMWNDLPSGADNRIRFRIQANIGAALMNLGELQRAGQYCVESYKWAPELPKAMAQKILGLTLIGDAKEAYDFGLTALPNVSDKASIITNMIFAAKHITDLPEGLGIVPSDLSDNVEILVAEIDRARTLGNRSMWRSTALRAYEIHPENELIQRFAAEATIDASFQQFEDAGHKNLPPEIMSDMLGAVGHMQKLWDKYRSREDAWSDFHTSLGANLSNAYLLLRRMKDARQVVSEGLVHAPDDPALCRCSLILAIDENDRLAATAALAKLPPSRDTIMARLQLAANGHQWQEIRTLESEVSAVQLNDGDRAFLDSASLVAKFELGELPNPKDAANEIIRKYPGETSAYLFLYDLSLRVGDKAWSESLYEAALGNIQDLSVASRIMLSQLTERNGDHERTIELLEHSVPLDQDSEELRRVARAYVNLGPRKDSLLFLERLSSKLLDHSYFALVAADIHFNRGALPQAEIFFRAALVSEPQSLSAHLGLLSVFVRRGQAKEISDHLRVLAPERLRGTPFQKMQLAHFLNEFGNTRDAIALGYEVAISNLDNHRIAEMYVGLLLPDSKDTDVPSVVDEVQVNSWVEIKNELGQSITVIVEDGPDRPMADHYSPTHELSKSVLGRRLGNEVALPNQKNHRWIVSAIKHKYVALLHRIMNAVHMQGLSTKSMQVVETEGDDVSPILNKIRAMGERDESLYEAYYSQSFPICIAAELLGKSSVEFASAVRMRGRPILTCVGTEEERRSAISAANQAREKGAVLDTYTAWTAALLKVVPTLKTIFGRVVITRATIDELLTWKRRFESHRGQPIMTLGYHEGKYFREHIDAKSVERSAEAISDGIHAIETNFEIIPAEAPHDVSPLERRILEIGRPHVIDPIFAALHENLFLVSDDMNLRKLAKQLHNIEGTWLQALLMMELESEKVSIDEYALIVSELAAARHQHVSLGVPALISMVTQDKGGKLDVLRKGLTSFGGEGADERSHVTVSTEFMLQLWHADLKHVRKTRAIRLMLEKLKAMFDRQGAAKAALSTIARNLADVPELHRFITKWILNNL